MDGEHRYEVQLEWQGDLGEGTSGYRTYSRQCEVRVDGKLHQIAGSSDPMFRGDQDRWNPEELLLAALSQCHLLSYLHVATSRGLIVRGYTDSPVGMMREDGDGGGSFAEVTLRPVVTVADSSMCALADELHAEASSRCFIATSMNFEVRHESTARPVG